MFTKITKELKAVNNKALVKEISTFMDQIILELGEIRWNDQIQREQIVAYLDNYMSELSQETKSIVNYKVVMDRRNNKTKDMDNGVFHLDVCFKQKNCINITQILYTIQINFTVPDTIDFVL